MGVSTVLVGFLPTHASIGFAAHLILVLLWLIQGLGRALGGQHGGAATTWPSAPERQAPLSHERDPDHRDGGCATRPDGHRNLPRGHGRRHAHGLGLAD
jgi:hypothetical protein